MITDVIKQNKKKIERFRESPYIFLRSITTIVEHKKGHQFCLYTHSISYQILNNKLNSIIIIFHIYYQFHCITFTCHDFSVHSYRLRVSLFSRYWTHSSIKNGLQLEVVALVMVRLLDHGFINQLCSARSFSSYF